MSIPVSGSMNPSLTTAVGAGDVSQATADLLSVAPAFDLGINPDEVHSEKVTLCVVLLDDSASMSGQHSLVTEALNERILFALKQAQTRNDVLIAITSLWHGVRLPFTSIKQIERFDGRKYNPDGDKTPLYRGIRDTLSLCAQKQGELAAKSIPARVMFLVLTDGAENVYDVDTGELTKVVQDIDGRKNNAIYGVAFGDEAESSLRAIGIKRISMASNPVDLAEAFSQFSRATSAAAST